MTALRIALAFGRIDVDGLKGETDHEQWEEWCDFFTLEPFGWQADRIAIQRLSYVMVQSHSRKRVKERSFEMKIGANIHSPETEKARFEAMSICTEITARLQQHG